MEAINNNKLSIEKDDKIMSVTDQRYQNEQPSPSGRFSLKRHGSSKRRRVSIYLTLNRMFGRDTPNTDQRDVERPRQDSHQVIHRPTLDRLPDSPQYIPSRTSNVLPVYRESPSYIELRQASPSYAVLDKDHINNQSQQNIPPKQPKKKCNKLWYLIILLLLIAAGTALYFYFRPDVECSEGPPPLVTNGKILDETKKLESSSFPAYTTFIYSCDEGYSLSTAENTVTCRKDGSWTFSSPPSCIMSYQTCSGELKTNPGAPGEVIDYDYPGGKITAFCDYVHGGGGWLVILKRFDGSQDFYKEFADYKKGFGSLDGEYWLGLDKINAVTNSGVYELRIDLEDFDGNKRYAKYSSFKVGKGPDYVLSLGGYAGDIGDSFGSSNGVKFSTRDFDQDTSDITNCAARFKGGWWYEDCFEACLTGQYLIEDHDSYADGIHWRAWRGYHYSLKKADMKIRLVK